MNESMIVTVTSNAQPVNAKYIPLYCFTCGIVTTHEKAGDSYRCDCGTKVIHIVNIAPQACAMNLMESTEARKRFDEWLQELL